MNLSTHQAIPEGALFSDELFADMLTFIGFCAPAGAECPLFKKVRLAGATIANCFDPASSSKEAVSSAPARCAADYPSCEIQCTSLQRADEGRNPQRSTPPDFGKQMRPLCMWSNAWH